MYKIQFRRDTAENWSLANPVLAEGELGLVLDSSNKYKIGDGVRHWNDLPFDGFTGNILNELGNDYDAVISQGGLSSILKNIINNNSKVDIDELDSINDRQKQGLYAIVPSGGNNKSAPIGHLLLTCDPMHHTVNQWVFGNFTIKDGNISSAHVDGCHSILVRSYNRGSGYLGDYNTWTKWRYYQQEFIKSEEDSYNDEGEKWTYGAKKIQSLLSSLKSTLEKKITWLVSHDNVTSIDALNKELDAFGAETAQGLHLIKCLGIPLFVTFSNLNVGESVLMQTIQGSITFNSAKTSIVSINATGNLTIAVRYYQGGKWGAWSTPLTPPTAQTDTSGTKANYVYSQGKDQDTKTILSSKMWIRQNGAYDQFLCFKHWGATNDTSESQCSQVMLPKAWIGGTGLLRWDIYRRLDDFELREENSTATEVKVVTPVFTTGGTRTLTLSKATSAKAGVMTATDKTLLSGLGGYLHPVTDNLTTLDALNTKLNGMGTSTEQGTHLIKCFGIPLTVTMSMLNVDKKVVMQTITGSITLNTDNTALASINGTGNYITLVRYYQEDKWGKWVSAGDSISASINVSQLDTYFMKEDDKGGVIVDMVKCKNAKPIYVVVDDGGNHVGLLFTHSDTMEHCLTLNLLTHLELKDDGSLDIHAHRHTYDYPKFYRKNLGFKFYSNAGENDPGYFEKLKASKWYCPLDEQFKRMVPTMQGSASGTKTNYVYSVGSDQDTKTIASTKFWIYKHNDFNLFLRFKHWGANNDEKEENYSQVQIPNAWTGSNGLLRRDIYSRLDAFELREQNSTATEVRVITPIFTTGGTRELGISAATSAKAGVMTATDKTKLDDISAECVRAAKKLYKATGNAILFGPNNIFDTNNGTLGGSIGKAIYDGSTPTEYTKGSPFEVFCTQGIKSDIDSNKYMIWFGLRKSATNIERYSCKQVIGQTESELYAYGTPVAFRLNDGTVYTPKRDSAGLSIGISTYYTVSRECVIPSYSDLYDAATNEKDGLLSRDIYRRLDGFELHEKNSTETEVKVTTPIVTTGGTREFSITPATGSKAGIMTAIQAKQLSALNSGLMQVTEGGKKVFRTLQGDKVIETHCDYVGEEVSLEDFNSAQLTTYTEGNQIELFKTKGAYGVPSSSYMVWFGMRVRDTGSSSYGALLRYDFKTIAGVEPLTLYKSGTGDKLHFWTRTKGYVACYRGSGGLMPLFRTVPYVMNTDDKALIDKIEEKL